jgi:hypothetical protein
LEFKVPSKWYRRAIGGLEIICGTVMMLVPSKFLKNGANIVLVVVKMLNAYSHWAINDAFERYSWKSGSIRSDGSQTSDLFQDRPHTGLPPDARL